MKATHLIRAKCQDLQVTIVIYVQTDCYALKQRDLHAGYHLHA